MATADTYDDLPSWIRPGAKLAAIDGGHALVTVTKITRAQIVAVADGGRRSEYRFNRTPVPARPPYRPEPEYRLRGTYSGSLVRRDHPHVKRERIDAIAKNATHEAEQARRVYGNPKASGDKRPIDERAMDLLDAIENAARKARRQIEDILDPGGMLAAEYAQNLNPTTEEQT